MNHAIGIPRTAMEVFNMLPEGTRCEVIDNAIYMSPSPTFNHQDVLGIIQTYFNLHVIQHNLGKVLTAPFDVYLNDGADVVQPDLLFLKRENSNKIENKGIIGAPDLVLEILSSNAHYDKETKFNLYQDNKVPQYIVVDPNTKEVWHYKLSGEKYVPILQTETGVINFEFISLTIKF